MKQAADRSQDSTGSIRGLRFRDGDEVNVMECDRFATGC